MAPVQTSGAFATRSQRPPDDYCPLDRAMQVVGNRTAMLLLREAFYGARRFDELTARVGITDAVAAKRLKELVAAGVLERSAYQEPGQRTRHEYVLTESGHALLPSLLGLMSWGDRHVEPDRWSQVGVSHAACGATVAVELRCSEGHHVDEDELVVSRRRVAGAPAQSRST